ncbi:hypothetical protein TBLA_0E02820 [Henningerozyma blattae CBS 6284]|uniref:C2H2-type domain-containing protein n=1 Tax=Henningerozyma blattae (strain ATCC 34711 / CBS 6284 / DSM 70876 / NBRC 10599 / NRRL Y-10934 / UCD 77-7) TaxID=1071380 RepID=I2H4N6_HENB6|nr:hypothetical protein TBLA_0E02820 [Tetrapisispora blattae CBS 6284]CCH61338.1 hypothetical protein TBLA_0E02820 [Tetrapisispora blattae CBS 6284]
MVKNGEEGVEGNYICHYCDASFRLMSYLTRHIKKHAIEKAFKCPFYNEKLPADLRCHVSGGFSRKDTFKMHLKCRHFIYPKGIKQNERSKYSGNCAQCGEFFHNSNDWMDNHISTGQCKSLPQGFRMKSEVKSGKLKRIKTSTGNLRFISTAKSVVEPNVLLNKDAIEAMAIVAKDSRDYGGVFSKYGDNGLMMKPVIGDRKRELEEEEVEDLEEEYMNWRSHGRGKRDIPKCMSDYHLFKDVENEEVKGSPFEKFIMKITRREREVEEKAREEENEEELIPLDMTQCPIDELPVEFIENNCHFYNYEEMFN